MTTYSVKAARNLARPRPLRRCQDQKKSSASVLSPSEGASQPNEPSDEDVLDELERFHVSVHNGIDEAVMPSQIERVYSLLKKRGPGLESTFPDQLDWYFVTLRNASRDTRLPVRSRLSLLELIELRCMGWTARGKLSDYYLRAAAPNPTEGASQSYQPSDEDVLSKLESFHISVHNGSYDSSTVSQIDQVYNLLKTKGPSLENTFKDQLDWYFVTLRNATRHERLPVRSRLKLLELIELRSMSWNAGGKFSDRYVCERQETDNYEPNPLRSSAQGTSYRPSFTEQVESSAGSWKPPEVKFVRGEVAVQNADSGKVDRRYVCERQKTDNYEHNPLRSSAQGTSYRPSFKEEVKSSAGSWKPLETQEVNFFKGEVAVRNADSGKVDRRALRAEVQISGYSEESTRHVETLTEDTIWSNASPIWDVVEQQPMYGHRESSVIQENPPATGYSIRGPTTSKDYTDTVLLGSCMLKLSSVEEAAIQAAKMVLERYVAGDGSTSHRFPEVDRLINSLHSSDPRKEETVCQRLEGQKIQQRNGPSRRQDDENLRDEHKHLTPAHRNSAAAPLMKPNSVVNRLPVQSGTSSSTWPAKTWQDPSKPRENIDTPHDASAVRYQPASCIPAAQPSQPAEAPETWLPPCSPSLRTYSKAFLTYCARSPQSNAFPVDFPSLDPEVADIMVRYRHRIERLRSRFMLHGKED